MFAPSIVKKMMTSVNDVRCCLFCLGSYSDECLPPTYNCLMKHIQPASYQAFIWKKCLLARILPPSPVGNGWVVLEGHLTIKWMDSNFAPDHLLEFANCGCKKGCSTQRCSYVKADLRCSDMCKCVNCVNNLHDTSDDEEYFDQPTEDYAEFVDDENQ